MRVLMLCAMVATAALGATGGMSARPTSKFTVVCAPGGRQCTFDGSSSDTSSTGGIVSYAWDWGNGYRESHVTPKATNTFGSGTWCVKLTVTDASGLTSYATKLITLPYVAGAKFSACPSAPTPKPDTVVVVDTILRVDTVRIQLPAPPPVHDTTIIVRVDTINTGAPVLPPGISVVNDFGDISVRWNSQLIGRLVIRTDGRVEAYRFNPAVTFGQLGLKSQGDFGTQVEAIAALLLPPPAGWTP